MKRHNPVFPPSPTLNSSPGRGPSHQVPGPRGAAFSGSFFLCFSQGDSSPPSLPCVYPTLCSKQYPCSLGLHSILLLLPHPQSPRGPLTLPSAGPGLRTKTSFPLPLSGPGQKPGGCPQVGGWPQGPSRISPVVTSSPLKDHVVSLPF